MLGGQLLADVQTFVAALDTMFGGFRERADVTYALLKEPATAFVVVAAPERDALREAAYFVDRLESEGMPLAGVVVNRLQTLAAPALSGGRAAAAAEQLEDAGSGATKARPASDDLSGLTEALLRLHADLAEVASRHEGHVRRFVAGHPGVRLSTVPASATDIHDLEGLREVGDGSGERLNGQAVAPWAMPTLAWLRAGRVQRPDVRGVAAQQRPALPLGHPAPDPELGAVVEGVREALGDHGAALAHRLGRALGLALDEQGVGVGAGAASQWRPVRDPLTSRGGDRGGNAHVDLCLNRDVQSGAGAASAPCRPHYEDASHRHIGRNGEGTGRTAEETTLRPG